MEKKITFVDVKNLPKNTKFLTASKIIVTSTRLEFELLSHTGAEILDRQLFGVISGEILEIYYLL